MKRIYDFSRTPARRNYTISDLRALKGSGKTLTMSNPDTTDQVKACVEAGIDLLLVDDENMDEVRRVAPTHFMGTGATWATFDSDDQIIAHAYECMRKGSDIYYTLRSFELMERMAREGIPIRSHIGLIPTFSHYCGGLRGWGRKADEAMKIFQTLKRMEDIGVVMVEVECVAEEVLAAINEKTTVVTCSLGAGKSADVIFSFIEDVCGEASEEEKLPKHAHAFGSVGRLHQQIHDERVAALGKFQTEVEAQNFPYKENNIRMHDGEHEKFLEALDKWTPA
ncbi:MAG: 3-methyl-2-oxobutanoate hydroxymethyltransferase [Pseudomonadota bacterium]